jgi:RNA-binding protein
VLNGRQRRFLRALGHHLAPVVHVGKDGVTDGLLAALAAALERHELIKVRMTETAPDDRHDTASACAAGTAAELVQVLGRTLLLYRARDEEPAISLPA